MVNKIQNYLQSSRVQTLIVFIVSLYSIQNQIISWDDDKFLYKNIFLNYPTLKAIKHFFTNWFHGDYIPLTMLSYYFEFKILGFKSEVYHLTNILIHTLNSYFLHKLLSKLKVEKKHIFVIVLIFGLHPMQVESFAWISERKGLLSTFFILNSMIFFLKKNIKYYIFSILFFTLSILSKTNYVTFFLYPLALTIYKNNFKQSALKTLPFLLIGIVISLNRLNSLGEVYQDYNQELFSLKSIFKSTSAIGHYLYKFLIPIKMQPIYEGFSFNIFHLSLSFLGFLFIILMIVRFRKNISLIYCTIFIFPLIPVLHFVPWLHFVNDRYMYLPIVGLVGLFLKLLTDLKLTNLKYFKETAIFFIIGTIPLNLIAQQKWKNSITFWESVTSNLKFTAPGLNNLGLAYYQKNEIEKAKIQFEKLLKYENKDALYLGHNSLGVFYSDDKNTRYFNLNKAIFHFKQSVNFSQFKTNQLSAKYNLSAALIKNKEDNEAIKILIPLIKKIKENPDTRIHFLYPKAIELINKLKNEQRIKFEENN